MIMEKPYCEFVTIDLEVSAQQYYQSACHLDQSSTQGGGSCIGNQDHSQGGGCSDTAPLISG